MSHTPLTVWRSITRALVVLATFVALATGVLFHALPRPPAGPVHPAVLPSASWHGGGSAWRAIGLFGGIVSVGFALCAWRLREEVAGPLRRLARGCRSDSNAEEIEELGRGRNEIGSIARSIRALRGLAHEWRRHAESVERRMGTQLAQETQRIMDEMKRVQRETWLDPLTKLYNRRLLDEKFPQIYRSQTDAGKDLSVVMMDIDHFKALNDTLGHAVGDEVLAFAGELLRQCLRNEDLAVRYGGDEFLLVLPGVTAHEARALTRRVISLFNQRAKMMAPIPTPPRLSAGIASTRRNRPSKPAELLAQADRAMYEAKHLAKTAPPCTPETKVGRTPFVRGPQPGSTRAVAAL